MENNNVALIIVAIVANLPTAIALFRDWKKIQAEKRDVNISSEAKISEMALGLIEPYRDRVQEFEVQVKELQDNMSTLQSIVISLEEQFQKVKAGAKVLYDQLVEHKIDPNYTPPNGKEE